MSKDLTEYEYEGLVDRITELYENKEGIGGGVNTTTGQMLIELLADVTDGLHYMLERRSQETFISTARLASSVRAAASSIGYLSRRRVSARGTLELQLLDENTEDPTTSQGTINIPYGTNITFDGEDFIVAEDAALLPGDSTASVPVVQGIRREETFNFSNEPYFSNNYLVIEDYETIEEFSIKVFNDGIEYFYVDEVNNQGERLGALSFAGPDTKAFDMRYTSEGLRILFGDGEFGQKPEGDVTVTWIESQGGEVNVINTDLEFEFDSEFLFDDEPVNPANRYRYILTNTSPINGGQDEETIEEMKQSVAEYIRTNDRAVTNFDYMYWVRRSGIGDIVDVNAYGEHENDTIIFTMNNVFIPYIRQDRTELNQAQHQQLRDYLDRYKVNTTHLVIKPAVETPLRLTIDLRRHPQLPVSEAQLYRDLRSAVYDYFAVKKGTIGKSFQHSEFIEYLQNYRINFNNASYLMTDFVNVEAHAFFPFTVPTPAYDGIIELDTSYAVIPGDVWTVVIDGVSYAETVRQSDTVETLVLRMRQKLFAEADVMIASPESNQIRIKHPDQTGTFTVSVGFGDLAEFTIFRQLIQLPLTDENQATALVPQIKSGTATIYNSADTPIMRDIEGNGVIESLDGYFFPDVLIDYQKCLMELPSVPNGDYYVEYQQNDHMNFNVARDGYVGVSDIPTYEELGGPTVYYSSINLL